jgi:hypothetical protein
VCGVTCPPSWARCDTTRMMSHAACGVRVARRATRGRARGCPPPAGQGGAASNEVCRDGFGACPEGNQPLLGSLAEEPTDPPSRSRSSMSSPWPRRSAHRLHRAPPAGRDREVTREVVPDGRGIEQGGDLLDRDGLGQPQRGPGWTRRRRPGPRSCCPRARGTGASRGPRQGFAPPMTRLSGACPSSPWRRCTRKS